MLYHWTVDHTFKNHLSKEINFPLVRAWKQGHFLTIIIYTSRVPLSPGESRAF